MVAYQALPYVAIYKGHMKDLPTSNIFMVERAVHGKGNGLILMVMTVIAPKTKKNSHGRS